jgi:hypothetical protein
LAVSDIGNNGFVDASQGERLRRLVAIRLKRLEKHALIAVGKVVGKPANEIAELSFNHGAAELAVWREISALNTECIGEDTDCPHLLKVRQASVHGLKVVGYAF